MTEPDSILAVILITASGMVEVRNGQSSLSMDADHAAAYYRDLIETLGRRKTDQAPDPGPRADRTT